MHNDSNLANILQRTHLRKHGSNLGITIFLSLILGISGSISYAALGAAPLNHKAPQRRSISTSTPVVVPTTPPVQSHTKESLPVLNAPLYDGNTRLPEVALTFDDGPNPYYTPQILAILQHYDVKATFFDVGYLVQYYPSIVRQEYEEGHLVANHSWSHPLLTSLSAQAVRNQLARTSAIIQAVTGNRPIYFRPPYGSYNNMVITQAKSFGLSTIIWNDEARDWTLPGVGVIISRILNLARDGAIILLHDGGGFRAQTVSALPYIITSLRSRGYSFVTIEQMVRHLASHTNASPTAINAAVGDYAIQPVILKVSAIMRKREQPL